MKVEQGSWNAKQSLEQNTHHLGDDVQLVLYFGAYKLLKNQDIYQKFKTIYPNAIIAGCSTGGEIFDREYNEDSCSYCAISFANSEIQATSRTLNSSEDSYEVGKELAQELNKKEKLRAVFLLSEGLVVNGSALVKGVNDVVDISKVVVTGGLAGDGDRFQETLVGCNANPTSQNVVAIGFYGDDLDIRWGSQGGWETFGPERLITKSSGNIMYELDGKPALDLYKRYLGDEAENLPASALYFPLAIWPQGLNPDHAVTRTILAVDENNNSLIFSGDVPEGWNARLMWGKFDNIVEGAAKAAEFAAIPEADNSFSILISCLGRKALMGQQVVNEVEESANMLGANNSRLGFYSYGEIAPHYLSEIPVLHNQTMTITTISEK
ncbi:FIST N and FIST C domain-containing protein [Candidatus Bealeia paramacronuclearis]|uniref:FIST N and FIST C domain-containing protein n=1 Tax=Candidatus Bealeia paramacronuclearis TaxID=1921001 RepID=A0ABZ2C659_9PROT|nr:FIST N and FIST C domain-containing protein [Candidatus Bealeia paramacronuclearis]